MISSFIIAIHKGSVIRYDFSLSQFREGGLQEFNTVFDKYYDTMYVFAYSLVWASQVAQGIVLEAFVTCWQSRSQWGDLSAIKSILYQVTRNVLHQKARGVRILRISFLKKALLQPQEYSLSFG